MSDPAGDELRYFRLRQRGSRERLLAMRLGDLKTIGDLLRVLEELDQEAWLRERGIKRD